MDPLSSVSPSTILPPTTPQYHHHQNRRWGRISFLSSSSNPANPVRLCQLSYSLKPCRRRRSCIAVRSKLNSNGGGGEEEGSKRDEELERALRMDGSIPGTSNEFVKQMSSRAYDMRRHLQQTFDSSSYDDCVSVICLKNLKRRSLSNSNWNKEG